MPWEIAKSSPFSGDVWELYNIDEDFSQSVNLAAERPDILRRLQRRWLESAVEFGVFPLNDNLAQRAGAQGPGRAGRRAGVRPTENSRQEP